MAELPRSPARSPLLCLMGVVALASGAAAADKTVWDAVYSEAQAARGKAVYDTRCAPCHGPELAGINFNGPAMKGDRFWAAWGDDYLGSLFEKLKGEPPSGPSQVSDTERLDVIAYVLKGNSAPAGAGELDAGALEDILIATKQDAAPPPNMSLVRVIGCLAADPDKDWVLTRATEPRLGRERPMSARQLTDAAQQPMGTRVFTLLDADLLEADAHVGSRIEAKGILIRMPKEDRINLTALTSVSDACRQ